MADRKPLHALVDSLPDGALDSAERYLQAIQRWPPKQREYPPEVVQRRKELVEKRDKFLSIRRSGTGVWFIDRNNKSNASFSNSEHNSETGELTEKMFRLHHDFPMEITERFRMKDDDKTLEYEFHISGLGNEHGFVLQFKADGG